MVSATVVFVVDTSSSMNQKTVNGMSLLDVAKSAIEHFIKMRSKQTHAASHSAQQQQQQDRFMLVTCANTLSQAIKIGWSDSTNSFAFLNALRNLGSSDLTILGLGLRTAFDLLNQYRVQYNTDSYGQGRYPHRCEPASVIVFTDGSGLTSTSGVSESLVLPSSSRSYSSQLTMEPFRWEQRVFCCLLKLPSISPSSTNSLISQFSNAVSIAVASTSNSTSSGGSRSSAIKGVSDSSTSSLLPSDDQAATSEEKPIDMHSSLVAPICETTGGQCRTLNQMGQTMHYMEELATASGQMCVVVNFELVKRLATNNTPDNLILSSQRTILYVPLAPQQQQAVGLWPIPESYYPEISMTSMPPRAAHPTIFLMYHETDFLQTLQRNKFPCVDTYEIDVQSSLARYVINNTSSQQQGCYKAYVLNSGVRTSCGPYGEPFAFVRKVFMPPNPSNQNPADPQNYRVFLYVLPYNFPRFFYLMDELIHNHKMKPTNQWKQNFEKYVQRLPPYYINPLKIALKRYNNMSVVFFPDHIDGSLPYSLTAFLKKMKKEEKMENEKLASIMQQQNNVQASTISSVRVSNLAKSVESKESDNDFRSLLHRSSFHAEPNASTNSNDDSTSSPASSPEDGDEQNVGSTDTTKTSSPFSTGTNTAVFTSQMMVHKNPFDVSRSSLLQQLRQMSSHLYHNKSILSKLNEKSSKLRQVSDIAMMNQYSKQEIQKHSVPIHLMGNFDEVIRRRQILRDPLAESKNPNQVNFGSPFEKRKRRSRSPSSRRGSISKQQHGQEDGNAALLGDEMEIMEMKEEQEAQDLKSNENAAVNNLASSEVQSPLGIPLDTAAMDGITNAASPSASDGYSTISIGADGEKRRKIARAERYDKARQQELVITMVNNNDPEVTLVMKSLPDKILNKVFERTVALTTLVAAMDERQMLIRNEILSIFKERNVSILNQQWNLKSRRLKSSSLAAVDSMAINAPDNVSLVLNKIQSLKFYNVQSERLFVRDLIAWAVEFNKLSIADALCNYEKNLGTEN